MSRLDNKTISKFIDSGLNKQNMEEPSMSFNSNVLNKLNLSQYQDTVLLSKAWIKGIIISMLFAFSYSIFVLFYGIEMLNTSNPYIAEGIAWLVQYAIIAYQFLSSQSAIMAYTILCAISFLMLIDQAINYLHLRKFIYSTE